MTLCCVYTYASSVKNIIQHGIAAMRFAEQSTTLCYQLLLHVQTSITLCTNTRYVLCKHLLRYGHSPIVLCSHIFYVMCNHGHR